MDVDVDVVVPFSMNNNRNPSQNGKAYKGTEAQRENHNPSQNGKGTDVRRDRSTRSTCPAASNEFAPDEFGRRNSKTFRRGDALDALVSRELVLLVLQRHVERAHALPSIQVDSVCPSGIFLLTHCT